MKIRVMVLVLVLLSAIPQGISFFQFIHNGGLQWPMHWLNETTAWGLIFSAFAVAAILISLKQIRLTPIFSSVVILAAIIVIFPSYYNLIAIGLEKSSKQDVDALKLAEFWISMWWK